jgi:hypothetical protein
MNLLYGMSRLRAALIAAVFVWVPLAVFFFPVTVMKSLSAGRRSSGVTCFTETEFISFRPIWHLDGLPPDGTGLAIESLIVLSMSVGVWALYPAFKPPPTACG